MAEDNVSVSGYGGTCIGQQDEFILKVCGCYYWAVARPITVSWIIFLERYLRNECFLFWGSIFRVYLDLNYRRLFAYVFTYWKRIDDNWGLAPSACGFFHRHEILRITVISNAKYIDEIFTRPCVDSTSFNENYDCYSFLWHDVRNKSGYSFYIEDRKGTFLWSDTKVSWGSSCLLLLSWIIKYHWSRS